MFCPTPVRDKTPIHKTDIFLYHAQPLIFIETDINKPINVVLQIKIVSKKVLNWKKGYIYILINIITLDFVINVYCLCFLINYIHSSFLSLNTKAQLTENETTLTQCPTWADEDIEQGQQQAAFGYRKCTTQVDYGHFLKQILLQMETDCTMTKNQPNHTLDNLWICP